MGPSIGWVYAAKDVVVPISVTGTTTILVGTSLVTVAVNGNVSIQLPSAKGNAAGAGAVPGTWVITPITVVDIAGFANGGSVTYTILPVAGETIDGLSTIAITTPYAAFVLRPNIQSGGWTLTQ
jgi:hypothetical protein